jgi:long-subunit fatty acid transport protein
MTTYHIEHRITQTINTDPQRRCYNGCYAKTANEWSRWHWLEIEVPETKIEEKLQFWRDLNDFAVSQRGEDDRREFRAVPAYDLGFSQTTNYSHS